MDPEEGACVAWSTSLDDEDIGLSCKEIILLGSLLLEALPCGPLFGSAISNISCSVV